MSNIPPGKYCANVIRTYTEEVIVTVEIHEDCTLDELKLKVEEEAILEEGPPPNEMVWDCQTHDIVGPVGEPEEEEYYFT